MTSKADIYVLPVPVAAMTNALSSSDFLSLFKFSKALFAYH